MQRIDVAYVLIVDETDRVLMVQNADNQRWTLPGGAVEPGETLAEAAVREAFEETGLTVRVGDLVAVNECVLSKHQHHALFFTFRAEVVQGEPHVTRPDEISTVEWVDHVTADQRLIYHPQGIRGLLASGCAYVDEGIE